MGGFWCALKKKKHTHLYGRFLVCTAWLSFFFFKQWEWDVTLVKFTYLVFTCCQVTVITWCSGLSAPFSCDLCQVLLSPFFDFFFLFFFLLWMVLPYKVAANIVIHFDVCVFSPVAFVCYYHTIKHGYFWGLISWFVLYHFTASWTSLLYTT